MDNQKEAQQILDKYLVFDRNQLKELVRSRKIHYEMLNHMEQLSVDIGRKFFVMETTDPLVGLVMQIYIKAMNTTEKIHNARITKKDGTDQRLS